MQKFIKNQGVTLIELMIVIIIIAILLAVAIPSFQDQIDRNRLKAATETLYADLQFAKSEAFKRNQSLLVDFKAISGASQWCYGLKANASSCDCEETNASAPSACSIDGNIKVVNSRDYSGVSLTFNQDFQFQNIRGTTQGTTSSSACVESSVSTENCIISLTSARNKQTMIIPSGMGRITACSPSGSNNVAGYSVCP